MASARCHCPSASCVLGWDRSSFPPRGVLGWARTSGGPCARLASSVGPQRLRLVTSLPLVPCYGPVQEPLQQTHFYDSDTVLACVTHVFLFAFSHLPGTHTHTHAPVQRVLLLLRGCAYMRLSSLFAGVLPNRCPGCLTWTCFTGFSYTTVVGSRLGQIWFNK